MHLHLFQFDLKKYTPTLKGQNIEFKKGEIKLNTVRKF